MSVSLARRFGLLQATALNMSNMIGIGPFITIPILMSALDNADVALTGVNPPWRSLNAADLLASLSPDKR